MRLTRGCRKVSVRVEEEIGESPAPAMVYTYLSAQHAVSNIDNLWLKVCEADKTNDLFEFNWDIQFDTDSNHVSEYEKRKWSIFAFRQMTTNDVKFISFSDSAENPLLWGYYGDRSRGICLGFSSQMKVTKDLPICRVNYNKPVALPVGNISRSTAKDKSLFLEFLKTKKPEWSHEREWRLLIPTKIAGLVPQTAETGSILFWRFPSDSLREVVFGAECPRETIQQVRSLCSKRQLAVKFSQIVCDYDTFEPLKVPLPDNVPSLS